MSVGQEPLEARAPDPSSGRAAAGRDLLLDLVRSVAIVRVVLWHTWSWAWLSWVPAMPAMFFTTGALLDASLRRRGWVATLRQRARRLFLPYWVYAAAAICAMWASGWRPDGWEVMAWVLPLTDPVGSVDMAGLWVPLWYVRAYLWFVLVAGVIGGAVRRFGWAAVGVACVAAAAVAGATVRGLELPMAVGDAVIYLPFVAAGMAYAGRRLLPGRAVLALLAVAAAATSVVVWQRLGPADGVVNRSYLLTATVGIAGLALVLGLSGPLTGVAARHRPLVQRLNSRALTIYLWQGFGLVAAQRLVDGRVQQWWIAAPLSLVIVVAVILAAVAVFGVLEDVAAGRRALWPALQTGDGSDTSPVGAVRRSARSAAVAVPGVALTTLALVVPAHADATLEAPLSGQAVIARAGEVDADLADGEASTLPIVEVYGRTAQEVLEEWTLEHTERLDELGTGWIDAAVVRADGTLERAAWRTEEADEPDLLAWMSMTKSVTAAWLVQLAREGVVSLDDPVARWVPEVPRAEDMTLELLARHRAGVPVELDRSYFEASPRDELDDFIARGALAYEPGEGFGYSRVGYYVLALALERASGTAYTDVVSDMAARAGVEVRFDDDGRVGPVTDPDGRGYRGGSWASGGILSDTDSAARLLRWVFTEGLDPDDVELVTRFGGDPESNYYGLGVLPLCPCERDGAWVRAARFGTDTLTALFGVDPPSGSTVVIRADVWWQDGRAEEAFHGLLHRLLDVGAST